MWPVLSQQSFIRRKGWCPMKCTKLQKAKLEKLYAYGYVYIYIYTYIYTYTRIDLHTHTPPRYISSHLLINGVSCTNFPQKYSTSFMQDYSTQSWSHKITPRNINWSHFTCQEEKIRSFNRYKFHIISSRTVAMVTVCYSQMSAG